MFFKKKSCNLCGCNQSIKTKTETKDRNDLVTENMKTTMKQLTAGTILTLIMLVGNVNAEGTQAKASKHENAIETTLQVEKWMTDERNFSGTGKNQTSERTASFEISTSKFVYREVNTEEELKVEPWMIDPKVWK